MKLKIDVAKNKFLSTIRSAEMIPTASTDPSREHYQNAYFMFLYNLTPLGFWQHFFNTNLTPGCESL